VDFEWDPGKRAANLKKHGLDFRDAAAVFSGPLLVKSATSGGEARFLAVGVLAGREVAVIYTMRRDRYRIISMRRARDGERKAYREALRAAQR
jgi:uncharacterized DUF497 family protein